MAVGAVLSPKIAMGYLNLSAVQDSMQASVSQDAKDVTTFGSGGFATYVPGFKTLNCSASGVQDFASGGIDEFFRVNGTTQTLLTIAPIGDTVGNAAVFTKTIIPEDVFLIAKVGDVPTWKFSFVSQATPMVQGLVTSSSSATVTATGNSTTQQVGAPSAAQTVYCAIHVLSITGTASPTLTCQLASAATSGGSYTTRGSAGSGLTAIGTQWLTAAGAQTDTWWRLNFTVSGTTPVFTIIASIGIV